jgi:DNA-binding CsgD family transcriptional regulator/tetratricopeptide (TPR) repeat protein
MADDLNEAGPSTAAVRRLLGREPELDAIATALTDLASGTGRAIALVGEPGVGKSALIWAAAAQARADGVAVRTAHGRAAVLPSFPDKAVRGTQSTVAVAVDDLHRLPADRIADVERLLEATATAPVLCLLAYRQRQLSPALAAVLSRAASAGLLEVRSLGPLTAEQSGELLGGRPDADELHRRAEGNPLYLKLLAAEGDADGEAGTAILGELAELDAEALAVVRVAAVLGGQFHPELLAAVAELDLPATMTALDALTRLDLIRPTAPAPQLTFRHSVVGETVYQRIEPSRRFALHRRAEAVLAERSAPIAERARHVARAADPARPEHVTTLIAAARGLLYTAPAVAVGHLQAVMPLLREGEAHWHEAQVLLARTRLLTGDPSESRALLEALRSTMPGGPPRDSTAIADSSRIERRLGRYTEAGAIARSGLAALADEDSATAAALHIELADYAYDVQDYETSRRHADTAATIARRHRDPMGEANALAQAALAHLFTGDQSSARTAATRAAELVDAAGDTTLLANLEACFQLGMTEGMLGRLVDAERHLGRAAALSGRTGQTFVEPQILTSLANAQVRSGNLHGGLATLDRSAHHVERVGNPATAAVIAMLRSEVLFWRDSPGDLPQVSVLADRAAELAGTEPLAWSVSVRCFNAQMVLLMGDPARAAWLLLDVAGGTLLPRLTVWRRPRWCDVLAEAASAEGDLDAVEYWAALAESSVEELPSVGRLGFALRARMRAHAMRGQVDRALDSAREAVADFSVSGERVEVCRTLLDAVALSLDAGRTQEVSGWLDRVAVLAAQCGSARLADAVALQRGRLAAHGETVAVPGALAGLTAREREIADLAGTGMTSGEIAAALFLSVRTVDSHLGRVYRKLDVPNRAGLIRTLLDGTVRTGRDRS